MDSEQAGAGASAGDMDLAPTQLGRQTTPQVENILQTATEGPLADRMHDDLIEDDGKEEEAPAPLASNHAPGDVAIPPKLGRQTTPQVESAMLSKAATKTTSDPLIMATIEDEMTVLDDAPSAMPQDHALGDVLKPVLHRKVTPTVDCDPVFDEKMHESGPLMDSLSSSKSLLEEEDVVLIDDASSAMLQDHAPGDVLQQPKLGRQATPACTIDAIRKKTIAKPSGKKLKATEEDEKDDDFDPAAAIAAPSMLTKDDTEPEPSPRTTRKGTPMPQDLQAVAHKIQQENIPMPQDLQDVAHKVQQDNMGSISELENTEEEEEEPSPRTTRKGTPIPQDLQAVAHKVQQENMGAISETLEGHEEPSPRTTRMGTPMPQDLQAVAHKVQQENNSMGALSETQEEGEEEDPSPRTTRKATPMPEELQDVAHKIQQENNSMGAIPETEGDKNVTFEQGEESDPTQRKMRMGTPMPQAMQAVADKLKEEPNSALLKETDDEDAESDPSPRVTRLGTPMPQDMQAVSNRLKMEGGMAQIVEKEPEKTIIAVAAAAVAVEEPEEQPRGIMPNLMRRFRSLPNIFSGKPKEAADGK